MGRSDRGLAPPSIGQTDSAEDERGDEGGKQRRLYQMGREYDGGTMRGKPGDNQRLGGPPNAAPESPRLISIVVGGRLTLRHLGLSYIVE